MDEMNIRYKGKRIFLTAVERAVFMNMGVPVRYVRDWRQHLGNWCTVCGAPAKTAAHKIPYTKGI
jgi:hypothetical protein